MYEIDIEITKPIMPNDLTNGNERTNTDKA